MSDKSGKCPDKSGKSPDESDTPSADKSQYVDSVMRTLGASGRYHVLQMLVCLSPNFAAALQLLGNEFIATDVGHNCSAPANTSAFYNRYQGYSNLSYEFNKCNVVVRGNGSVLLDTGCDWGYDYEERRDISAVAQFDLVCDREYLASLSQTLVILGQGIGAVLTTIASDKLGRKTVLIAANLGLFTCGMGIAYAQNYAMFAIFKFIIGGFQQGILTGIYTFCAELYPTEKRHLNAVFCTLSWALGVMLLPFVSWLCQDLSWRQMQAVYGVSNATVILQIFLMDESIRWLLANGKIDRAITIIKRASRISGVEAHPDIAKAIKNISAAPPRVSESEVVSKGANTKMTLLDVLKIKTFLLNTLTIWFAWFTTALGYFTIFLNATSLSGDPYTNFFVTAVANIPPPLLFLVAYNRLGRKFTSAVPFFTLAVGLFIQGLFQSFEESEVNNVVILISSLVGMVGASGCFGAVFSYTPELFPTNVRNQALGLSSFVGRLGGMLAPFTSVIADAAVWGPGVIIGSMAVVVCLLLRTMPETSGRELPQTVDDLKAWYNKDGSENKKGYSNGGLEIEQQYGSIDKPEGYSNGGLEIEQQYGSIDKPEKLNGTFDDLTLKDR